MTVPLQRAGSRTTAVLENTPRNETSVMSLVAAARSGKVDLMDMTYDALLNMHPHRNTPPGAPEALAEAVRRGHPHIADALRARGVVAHFEIAHALVHASQQGEEEDVRRLCQAGAPPSSAKFLQAFHKAAKRDHIGVLRILINHAVTQKDEGTHRELRNILLRSTEQSALLYLDTHRVHQKERAELLSMFIHRGFPSAARALLTNGARPTRTDFEHAVESRRPAILRALLSGGVVDNETIRACLLKAAREGDVSSMHAILAHGEVPKGLLDDVLLDVSENDADERVIPMLLKHGSTAHAHDGAALVRAAGRADAHAVDALLASGAFARRHIDAALDAAESEARRTRASDPRVPEFVDIRNRLLRTATNLLLR